MGLGSEGVGTQAGYQTMRPFILSRKPGIQAIGSWAWVPRALVPRLATKRCDPYSEQQTWNSVYWQLGLGT